MTESQRIHKLFSDLYNGQPWLDVTLETTLCKITSSQAATKFLPSCNSIWEITNHIISWRENVLKRVQGEVLQTPENNYFAPVEDTSTNAWQHTLKKLATSQDNWLIFLESFQEENFSKKYPTNKMNYYEHIHGILQHDAYHMGQLVLLAKVAMANS